MSLLQNLGLFSPKIEEETNYILGERHGMKLDTTSFMLTASLRSLDTVRVDGRGSRHSQRYLFDKSSAYSCLSFSEVLRPPDDSHLE